jgi:hypothetical protein
MPRYLFHMPSPTVPEPEGIELPDLDAARRVATRTACAMIGQNVDEFWQSREWQMTVSDESGLQLFSLTFFASDAAAAGPVEIHLEPPPQG